MALVAISFIAEQLHGRTRARIKSALRVFFLEWRSPHRLGPLEWILTAIYVAAISIAMPHHEPWSDEAQAWLIARDCSAWEIVRHRLHYEGTPPLWHLLLHLFHLAHGTYSGVGWLGATCATIGVVIFLRYSPFPLAWRILMPFTFFIQYQYAVIARGYTLFALLVFLLCKFSNDKRNPIGFALIAGLLTNLSMQGAVVAFVIVDLYLIDLSCPVRSIGAMPWKRLRVPAAIYGSLLSFAVYTAIPAPDVNFAVGDSVSTGTLHKALVALIGETPPQHALPPPSALSLPTYVPLEFQSPVPPSSVRDHVAWFVNHRQTDSHGNLLPQSIESSVVEGVVSILSQATWPISTSNLLGSVFLMSITLWLYFQGSLSTLLPWFVLLIVGQILWVTDHHTGMLFISLLAGIWLGFNRGSKPPATSWPNIFLTLTGTLVFALQVGWSIYCIHSDMDGLYDPGRETARYLQENPVARSAKFHFWAESIQPYFSKNPFFNVSSQYWLWSENANPDPYYPLTLAQHPDRIVYSIELPGSSKMRNQWVPLDHLPTFWEEKNLPWDSLIADFKAHGYLESHRFCGRRFARVGSSFEVCDLIFEPAP